MQEQESIYKKLSVKAIVEEIPDFKVIIFHEGHQFNYQAGQYLTLVKYRVDGEVRRSYSIISAPALGEPLSIAVKRIENGFFSRYLIDDLKIGDTLLTTGIGGFFTLPENVEEYRQIFFFAAGSGITPMIPLIKTALHDRQHLSLVLVYSNSSLKTTAFLNELNILQEQYPKRLQLKLLFSNNPELIKARLHREMIFKIIDKTLVAKHDRALCYICGPENYMRLCLYSITEAGVPVQNIRRENFAIGPPPKIPVTPPDKRTHKVTITQNNTVVTLTVNYPQSILQAAKKQAVSLPYSCETGRCGSCVALCTKGEVWHSYNEILTDAELEKGLVLTCVGHPVDGDVELKIQ